MRAGFRCVGHSSASPGDGSGDFPTAIMVAAAAALVLLVVALAFLSKWRRRPAS
jgi:hypothetical protein